MTSRAAVAWAFCSVALAGACGRGRGNQPAGRVTLELRTTGAWGVEYQLADARFNFEGPETRVIQAALDGADVSVELQPGNYTIALADGWTMRRRPADGDWEPVRAVLLDAPSSSLTVVAAETTAVRFRFGIGDGFISPGKGRASIGIQIEEERDAGAEVGPPLSDPLTCARAALEAMIERRVLLIDVPPSCEASRSVCCTDGLAASACPSVELSFEEQPGDQPRLVLTTPPEPDALDATLRGRLRSLAPIPFSVAGMNCLLTVDSRRGLSQDVTTDARFHRALAPGGDRAVLQPGASRVSGLEPADSEVGGAGACQLLETTVESILIAAVQDRMAIALGAYTCSVCPCR